MRIGFSVTSTSSMIIDMGRNKTRKPSRGRLEIDIHQKAVYQPLEAIA
jgi:hypothetical protein